MRRMRRIVRPHGHGSREQRRHVAGAEPQDGHGLLAERGEHEFAGFAVGQRLAAIRVDDLGIEVVFEDMDAVLAVALGPHAGPDDLGQPVDVVGLDAGGLLDVLPHGVGPGLGAEDAGPQGKRAEIDAHFLGAVEDVQEVAGRATDGGDAEILHDHDLPVGVAAGGRDHGGPQPLAAIVQPQAAGEQPVAVGVLQDVAFVQAEGGQGPLDDFGPDIDVVAVVGHDDRLAGRAAGGVQADDLVHGTGEEAERIRVAQVGLHREGQARDVVDALDALRPQTGLVEPLAVEFRAVVHPADHGAEPLRLQFAKLRCGHEIGAAGGVKTCGHRLVSGKLAG